MQAELIDRIAVKATLGEGIVWDACAGHALWTDIQQHRFYRYDLASRTVSDLELDERLTAFGFSSETPWLVAAFESGFAWFNSETGAIGWIERPEQGATGRRFNDGRVGPCGRFWCGTMVEDADAACGVQGSLYCLDTDGNVSLAYDGISVSNSLCWSPSGATMYYADSPRRVIWSFDYDANVGVISNKRNFVETPAGIYPDGAVIDADGYLWSAQWGGGRVVRYSPDGVLDALITIPASQPSCVAFGGDDLDLLFVTTAREGLSPEVLESEPYAGDVFVYQTDCRGMTSAVFGGAPPQTCGGRN